jgi:peptidoglycan/xylan/chitin deacetylase (PgdA/CDA1 family)
MGVRAPISRRGVLGLLGGGTVAALGGCTSRQCTDADKNSVTEYESIAVFRNDDPNPWTDVETLRTVTQIFIDQEVPLTHGIVPYDDFTGSSLKYGHDLCDFYREIYADWPDMFEYALHGYHHEAETDFHGSSEFGDLSQEEQEEKISTGAQILKDCTGERPVTFIPPFNTYDETTVDVLGHEGFDLVSGGWYFQSNYFGKQGIWEDDGVIHLSSNLNLESWEQDIPYVRDSDSIIEDYEQNRKDHQLNVIMLHYHYFTEGEQLETLKQVVAHVVDDDSRILTLREFAEKSNEDGLERTENGWKITD